MSIILGLLTLIASIIVPLAITYFLNLEILHFSMLIIVPVGGIAIGYLCGFGYFKGLQKCNIFITKKHFFIGLILAILCIIGLEYSDYRLTCMDPQTFTPYYSLDGEHISNYELEGYGQLNFFNYKKFVIENTPVTFRFKHQEIVDVTNKTWLWIFNFIDYLGVIIGVFFAGCKQKEKPYCQTCKLYKKQKEMFDIKVLSNSDDTFFEDLKQRLATFDMGSSAFELLNSVKLSKADSKNKQHYLINIIFCDSCRTASLKFVLYDNNNKEVDDFEYEIPFNYDFISTFTNKINATAA